MESDKSEWEPELLESHLVGHDPEDDEFEIAPPIKKSKRGCKKLPVMWSRVISITEDGDEELGTYNIEFDMRELLNLSRPLPQRRGAQWAPIFQPTTYARDHPDLSLEAYGIGEKRLRNLGIEISKLRAEIRKAALHQAKAEANDQERDVMEISRLARKV